MALAIFIAIFFFFFLFTKKYKCSQFSVPGTFMHDIFIQMKNRKEKLQFSYKFVFWRYLYYAIRKYNFKIYFVIGKDSTF